MNSRQPDNKAVYSLAWPIGMNALLQQAILIIDAMLVAGLGEESLAATGIATSIAGLILGVLFAFANGTQILVAQAFGSASNTALKSGFWSGLIVGVSVAILGITFVLIFGEAVITSLTTDPAIAHMASSYLYISTLFIVGLAITQNISVFLYATGNPKIPFYSKLLELPVNALVSYSLIYGAWGLPELGVKGAAIGSVVAVLLRCVFLLGYLCRKKFAYLLDTGWTKNSIRGSVQMHLANAMPIAGTFISMNFSFTLCMMIYTQLKLHEFAAFTILFVWIRFSGMLTTAWAQALGIWVGRLLGQDRTDLLDGFVRNAWRIAHYLALAVAAIYCITPWLFDIIYPKLDRQTLDVFKTILPVLILLPLIRSSNTICGNVLRAAGQANYAFKVHVAGQWLFLVPMTVLFVLILKLPVIWVFGIVLFEEIVKAIPFHLRIASGEWKKRMAF